MKTTLKVFSFIVSTIIILFSVYGCTEDMDFYIFSNISECSAFEETNAEDVTINRYSDPSEDKHLKDIEYNEFYGAEYVASDFEFEIYAYEFKDDTGAKQYFKNVTGKQNNNFDRNVSLSGSVNYRLVVIDNNNGYTLYTSSIDYQQVKELLDNVFSIDINL